MSLSPSRPDATAAPAGARGLWARPHLLLWGLVAAQLVFWTLIPALTHPNAPLDVIEGLTWGREWQLGYQKHPPLQAWLLELTASLTGKATPGFFLLAQLPVAATYLAVWALAREFLAPRPAVVAVLLLVGVYYFSFPTPEFNPNFLQMPLWAATWLFVWRALERGRDRDWLLAAGFAALAVYAKYSALVLVAVVGLFLLADPMARRHLVSRGPWLAAGLFLLLLVPNLVWLVESDFLPFTYAVSRGGVLGGLADRLAVAGGFAGAQLADHLGLFALLFASGLLSFRVWPRPFAGSSLSPLARRFLLVAALGPFAAVLLAPLLAGIGLRDMWGAPLFTLSGLLAVALFEARLPALRPGRFLALAGLLFALVLLAYAGRMTLGAALTGEAKRGHFPGPAVGAYFEGLWRAETGRPLGIVAGSLWLGGNVAFYADSRPSVLVEGSFAYAPWVTADDIARDGALVVWKLRRPEDRTQPPPRLLANLPAPALSGVARFAWRTWAVEAPLEIGWAIVPPR